HMVTTSSALLIGAGGGVVCYLASILLQRLQIDDAVDAVPVHLAAGIWGTLAVALLGETSFFPGGHTRAEQFGVQLVGVAAAGAFAFTVAYAVLRIIDIFLPLRVSSDA